MTSRHHYSIPGASFLKPRSSSKVQIPKAAAPAINVPSSSRNTRQVSTSRAHLAQESVVPGAPVRPPSATGYRTQHSNTSVNNLHASGAIRQTPAQRPITTPPASSSRTRLDVPDSRNYFSKMFSRKHASVPPQREEKQKSSQKHQHNPQAHPPAHVPAAQPQASRHAGPSASRTAHDASLQARDSDRDDRVRQKFRDEITKEERERMRAEYAARKAKMQEVEPAPAATAKVTRIDRTAPRPTREERRQQEYESDNARRRLHAQQMGQTPVQKQEARQSYYLHPAQASAAAPRATAPTRDAQQTLGPQVAGRLPGVPIQPSNSSQSTSASHQVHTPHPAIRTEPIPTPNPLPAPPATAELPPPLPPKANTVPYPTISQPHHHNLPQQAQTAPPVSTMLPPFQTSGPDDRNRLDKEAIEREALLSQEREREVNRPREAEKQAADRERELERERRRVRRAERERKKDVERERRKDLEAIERERQKQAERERKALEALEQEKLREAERLRRERKEQERQERLKAERERQQEAERERLRERTERERERAARSTSKHRSHRDKSQSMPTSALLGAMSGSDTERMTSRKDGRHRSHSQSAAADTQRPLVLPNSHRPESRKDILQAPSLAAGNGSAPKKDFPHTGPSHHDPAQHLPKASTPQPFHPSQTDSSNPRNASAVPFSTQPQELTPPKFPERSRADPVFLPGNMRDSVEPALSNQPLLFETVQSKLVSIYASQGPSDRTASRAMQKIPSSRPTTDQRLPMASSAAPLASIAHEGHPRSSLDQSSRRASLAQPNMAPALGPTATPPLNTQTQHEMSTAQGALVQHSVPNQPRADSESIIDLVAPKPPVPEKSLPTPHGQALPFPDTKYPTTAQGTRQPSTTKLQTADDRYDAVKSPATTQYGVGFSSYSQAVFGLTTEPSRAPSDNQQFAPMSRAASNNSTKSRGAQLPVDIPTGAFFTMPVSRTASDASHSTQLGDRQQASTAQPNSQVPASSSLGQQQPTPTTPMYSSVPKAMLSSRVKHESFTNFHAPPVHPTHSHSQSLPLQGPLLAQNNSKDDVDRVAYDNLSSAHVRAPIPTPIPDASHQQYPAAQVSSSQNKAVHDSSINAQLPVQSQQLHFHPTLSSSIQDHKLSSRPIVNSNNVSSYSAAVASLDAMSQFPTTMHSQEQYSHQPSSSVYHNHNHSTSRNPIAHQAQNHQQPMNPTRPSLPQYNNNHASNAMAKPPVSPVPPRPSNAAVYVTSTRKAGPFLEESPSSIGGGLSLDSPPAVKSSFQSPLPAPDRFARHSIYNRPQSQVGPATPAVNSSHQSQTFVEAQKMVGPQDADTPPPLTPSSSSHDSHDEILMTPASLDQARAQIDVKQPPDSSQRPEKKKGGILRLFRSTSTKSTKDKERIIPREEESRRQVQGSQRDQRTESLNKPRSARPPSVMRPAEAEPNLNPTNVGSVPLNDPPKPHRAPKPKHVPPPISIPPVESIQFRLLSSNSRRYRTMSAASMEAVDGTANNTVVGSPTSSRRSPTPSGPLTPSARDPIEAAQAWRDNEEVFLDRGSQRRRRPGVTFDLEGDEDRKDNKVYRRTQQQLRKHRRESQR